MRPLDPRLLRWARATRAFLVSAVILGALQALVVIVQAGLIATVVTRLFLGRETVAEVRTVLVALASLAVLRALLAGGVEWVAGVTGTRAKRQLRAALVDAVVRQGPHRRGGVTGSDGTGSVGDIVVLATKGIDALDAYFARYLPQLIVAVVVPTAITATLLGLDVLSAVTVAVTLPLIPVFMALVGWYTQGRVDRQWRTLGSLSHHFLDVVTGLPTLAVFGRARAQVQALARVEEDYRHATMGVLRTSFLSALVLELLATLSVALVAVGIGVRLVDGGLDLRTGLMILILAPEAYLPLRMVGIHFHAAAEGLGAARRVLDILDDAAARRVGHRTDIDASGQDIVLEDLGLGYGSGEVVSGLSARIPAGRVTALRGPSGSGKSTVVRALLGMLDPDHGRVLVGDTPLADIDPEGWRSQVSYVAQRPYLTRGTVLDAARAGSSADDAQVLLALAAAGVDVHALACGAATDVGEGGAALSVGQRRRVALARALLRDTPLVILDEPTAALDEDAEAEVLHAVRALRARSATVIVVAHRPALLAEADHVVDVSASTVGEARL